MFDCCAELMSSARNTETSTFASTLCAILFTSRCTRIAPPNRNSAMNAVEMAAKTTNPLRRNACRVSGGSTRPYAPYPYTPRSWSRTTFPPVELDHPAAHRVDDGVVVRGHHHGGAGSIDAVEQLHDVDRRRRVEVPGGLVGQQDQRPVHERARDRHALLLAARQLVRVVLHLVLQPDQLDDLRHARLDDVLRLPDHVERERHVLVHGLVGEQLEVLEDRPHVAAQVREPSRRSAWRCPSRRRGSRRGWALPRGSAAGSGWTSPSRTGRRRRRTRPSGCRRSRRRARRRCPCRPW